MKIVVKHRSFYVWKLMPAAEVKEDDVVMPSIHGDHLKHVQVQYNEPNYTEIHVPDSDLDRMVEDHELGLKNARKGYTTTQVGGPLDGQEVVVPPRNMPHMTRNELLAEHLRLAVFPFHFPSDTVTHIKIEHHSLEDDDAAKLEKHLKRRLVTDDGGEPDPEPAKPKAKK